MLTIRSVTLKDWWVTCWVTVRQWAHRPIEMPHTQNAYVVKFFDPTGSQLYQFYPNYNFDQMTSSSTLEAEDGSEDPGEVGEGSKSPVASGEPCKDFAIWDSVAGSVSSKRLFWGVALGSNFNDIRIQLMACQYYLQFWSVNGASYLPHTLTAVFQNSRINIVQFRPPRKTRLWIGCLGLCTWKGNRLQSRNLALQSLQLPQGFYLKDMKLHLGLSDRFLERVIWVSQ